MIVSAFRSFNLGHLGTCILDDPLRFSLGNIPPGARADVGQSIPFIHSKFTHSDFDIQPIVIFWVNATLSQMLAKHVLMSVFTAFNFRYQPSSRFRKITHASSDKALPPLVLFVVCAAWSLARPNTHKYANVPPRILIDCGLVHDLRSRIIIPCTFVDENGLPDLYGLKG